MIVVLQKVKMEFRIRMFMCVFLRNILFVSLAKGLVMFLRRFSISYFFWLIFLAIFSDGFSQEYVSLISYYPKDDGVEIKWAYDSTNVMFSIYRSRILITNVTQINDTNNIQKIGGFLGSELNYKKGYFYFLDEYPFIGTNYYIVFVYKDGKENISLFKEQNYSESFVLYIPLPKVYTEIITNLNQIVISWDPLPLVDGYLVYKTKKELTSSTFYQTPLAVLGKNETIFFDTPSYVENFSYIVFPFVKGFTNISFSVNKNAVFVGSIQNKVGFDSSELTYYSEFKTNIFVITNVVYETNQIVITNFVSVPLETNIVIYKSNSVPNKNTEVVEVPIPGTQTKSNLVKSSTSQYEYEDFDKELKNILSLYFFKGRYEIAREKLYQIMEYAPDEEKKARVSIYIARCEFALGNKETSTKFLKKARKFLPIEADFWFDRLFAK